MVKGHFRFLAGYLETETFIFNRILVCILKWLEYVKVLSQKKAA